MLPQMKSSRCSERARPPAFQFKMLHLCTSCDEEEKSGKWPWPTPESVMDASDKASVFIERPRNHQPMATPQAPIAMMTRLESLAATKDKSTATQQRCNQKMKKLAQAARTIGVLNDVKMLQHLSFLPFVAVARRFVIVTCPMAMVARI